MVCVEECKEVFFIFEFVGLRLHFILLMLVSLCNQMEQMLQPISLSLDSLKLLNYIYWFLENQIANITSQIIGRPSDNAVLPGRKHGHPHHAVWRRLLTIEMLASFQR